MPARTQEKAARVLRFLLSLRHAPVRSAMMACSMTQTDADEGWTLLRALGTAEFEGTPLPEPPKTTIEDLLAWQTRWLGVATATLERHFPVVKDKLFFKLGPAYGVNVILTVALLVDRLRDLADPAGAYGPDGPRALALLATRGLTEAVIEQAESLLLQIRYLRGGVVPGEPLEPIARDEDVLWRWYIEWSTIARAHIKERALLRRMGLRVAGAANDEPDETSAPAQHPSNAA